MKVKQLIEHLKTLPPEGELVGQYQMGRGGMWVMVPIDERFIAKVPGDNNMVVFQLRVPEWVEKQAEQIHSEYWEKFPELKAFIEKGGKVQCRRCNDVGCEACS